MVLTDHGPGPPAPSRAATPTTLWVLPVSDLGGVARHALDVARHGIPGWRLVVLLPEGALAERLRTSGAAVLTGSLGPDAGTAASVRTVRRVVTRLRPAIVHSHLSYADVAAAAATAGLPVRLVTTEHGIADDDLVYHGTPARARLKAGLHTLRLRRADAVIAVSEATADVLARKWHPRASCPITVVHNGVDPIATVARDAGLEIVSLARLAPEKRIEDLLRGFAAAHARRPEATLVLAGEGPLRHGLAGLAEDLGVGDAVSLPGHVDPSGPLSSAHVLAQLSVWENCSYSLLDAVTHGLGVVATAVGGNPEILPARCLVDARSPERVASALLAQGLDPAARPRLPAGWPTVADMCAAVADTYARVAAGVSP